MEDIEYFQRQLTRSMAVPADTLVGAFEQLGVSTAQAMLVFENMSRVMKRMGEHQNEMVRSLLGLPPRSAIDRLADLVDDE